MGQVRFDGEVKGDTREGLKDLSEVNVGSFTDVAVVISWRAKSFSENSVDLVRSLQQ